MNRPPQLYQSYNPTPLQQPSFQTPQPQQQNNQMQMPNKMTPPPQNVSPIPTHQTTGNLNALSSQNGSISHHQEPFLVNNVNIVTT